MAGKWEDVEWEDVREVTIPDNQQTGIFSIRQDANLPGGLVTREQQEEFNRIATMLPGAPTAGFAQGIRETGQGFGQLGIGALDYLTNAPIKQELGIANNRLPEYNRGVLDQRAGFNETYQGIPGVEFAKTAGAIYPFMALPPVGGGGLAATSGKLGLLGANIAGSQFAETPEERAQNTATGGLLGLGIPFATKAVTGTAELAGKGSTKGIDLIQRLFGKQTPSMMQGLAGSPIDDQTAIRISRARDLGLDYLTPAEATGNPILAARQGSVGKTGPGQELLVSKSAGRINSEKKAIRMILDDISTDATPAGIKARDAAVKMLGEKRAALSNMAKPLYKAAHSTTVPDEWVAQQLNDPLIAKSVKDVAADPALQSDFMRWAAENNYKGNPQNTVKFWDLVRRRISDLAEPDKLSKATNEQRIAGDVARYLNKSIENVTGGDKSPYKIARNFFSEEAPRSQALDKSVVAKIAKLDDIQAKNVSKILFDPTQTSPKIMNEARAAFMKEDPALWRQLIRNEIERRISIPKTDIAGSTFYRHVLASDRDFKLFHNALNGDPSAQKKLRAARDVFGSLMNPPAAKSAEFQTRINVNQNRNVYDATQSALMDMFGGKMDRAAVEFITNPKWDKQFSRIAGLPKDRKAVELGKLLVVINNSLVKASAVED